MTATSFYQETIQVLAEVLQLGNRAADLTPDTRLLGNIAEFDSMAVVSVITAIEDRYGIEIGDDELSADVFESVGSLAEFIQNQCG